MFQSRYTLWILSVCQFMVNVYALSIYDSFLLMRLGLLIIALLVAKLIIGAFIYSNSRPLKLFILFYRQNKDEGTFSNISSP